MSDDIRSFELGLDRFVRQTVPQRVRNMRNAIALEAHTSLIDMTLYDTGRAKANWQLTVADPANGATDDTDDEDGSATKAKGEATVLGTADSFAPIWLHNGLPYIRNMNDGTHNFVKVGAVRMVETTVDRLRRMFR
jgi:hypothetical protein